MSPASLYQFHATPQFSVNHLSDYLATTNATQRVRVLCSAKFPKRVEVGAYAQVRTALRKALVSEGFDHDGLDFLADRMATKATREQNYQRDEALRCEKAVRAFQNTFDPKLLGKMSFHAPTKGLHLKVEGVKINVSLDAAVSATGDGVTHSGGIVIVYGFAADRGSIKDKLGATAGLILWALEGGQLEPMAKLCMAADIAEKSIIKASSATTRFRSRVNDSCREAATLWDRVEPPADYDGPDWH